MKVLETVYNASAARVYIGGIDSKRVWASGREPNDCNHRQGQEEQANK